ncbi:DUF3221 domain-containing protein [Bacillus sp. FJAT-27245]|uniref:DUF3221 domain-containing protein n=1 Tax=Bacillus sp. FJAT-27245 TaxID=1684144 RepID=UPI0006A7CCFB|nr:DUF3221 domain-containing protein [Bacillus sp. FJAT-27245]
MKSAVVTVGVLLLAICTSIFFTLAGGEGEGNRYARSSNAGDELEELGEGIRLGMDKEEVIQLWGEQPTNFDGIMDGKPYTAFQFRTGQWDITGSKEIALIGREAHQFGKTGKIIFVFWNGHDTASDVAICYRMERSEKFRSFNTGEAGKENACGTDGYVIVKKGEMFFVNAEKVPLFKNKEEAVLYFKKKGNTGVPIYFPKQSNLPRFLETGDKVKIWYDTKKVAAPAANLLIKELYIMDESLKKKD